MTIAIIADIVGSRRLADRDTAQRELETVIHDVEARLPAAEQPLRPTVGDELQGAYDDLDTALAAILLIGLALPDGVGCRFGLGVGSVRPVTSATASLQDGTGWWAAREAIEAVSAWERSRVARARSWLVAAADEPADRRDVVPAVNAGLLARDHLLTGMSARARRLAYGSWCGQSQQALAAAEGISQSAVSQSLSRSGAGALLAGLDGLLPAGAA